MPIWSVLGCNLSYLRRLKKMLNNINKIKLRNASNKVKKLTYMCLIRIAHILYCTDLYFHFHSSTSLRISNNKSTLGFHRNNLNFKKIFFLISFFYASFHSSHHVVCAYLSYYDINICISNRLPMMMMMMLSDEM